MLIVILIASLAVARVSAPAREMDTTAQPRA